MIGRINALVAARDVLIPTQAKVMALSGILPLLRTIEAIRKNYNEHLQILGVVACMFDGRTNLAKDVVTQLREAAILDGRVLNTVIRENVRLAEAYSFEQSIFEYAPKSYGAEDYSALAQEILNRVKG